MSSEQNRKEIHVDTLIVKADKVIIHHEGRKPRHPWFGFGRPVDLRDGDRPHETGVEMNHEENHDNHHDDEKGSEPRPPRMWI